MPVQWYKDHRFSEEAKRTIGRVNSIVAEYRQKGFSLTLRQVYYQCVARGWIPNNDREYKKLGSIISDARLAGLIDWSAITDRTRFLRSVPHWAEPAAIVAGAAQQFRIDKWEAQPYRVEVMVEKDALVDVIGHACTPWDVPYTSCRGYMSQSEMWESSQRILGYLNNGQKFVLIHLGDHDPSGIDMSRDIQERLELFIDGEIHLRRIALNMDQIATYGPPPNPAKMTDSRFVAYINKFGESSWELDALKPEILSSMISDTISDYVEEEIWDNSVQEEAGYRKELSVISDHYEDVVKYLREKELLPQL